MGIITSGYTVIPAGLVNLSMSGLSSDHEEGHGRQTFNALVAQLNVRDNAGQRFMPGELRSTQCLASAWNHASTPPARQSGQESWPVGVAQLSEENNYYRARGEMFPSNRAARAFEMWNEIPRELLEWSIWWFAEKTAFVEEDDTYTLELYEITVREVTPTMAGLSPDTRTVALGQSSIADTRYMGYIHQHTLENGSVVGCKSLDECMLHQHDGNADGANADDTPYEVRGGSDTDTEPSADTDTDGEGEPSAEGQATDTGDADGEPSADATDADTAADGDTEGQADADGNEPTADAGDAGNDGTAAAGGNDGDGIGHSDSGSAAAADDAAGNDGNGSDDGADTAAGDVGAAANNTVADGDGESADGDGDGDGESDAEGSDGENDSNDAAAAEDTDTDATNADSETEPADGQASDSDYERERVAALFHAAYNLR